MNYESKLSAIPEESSLSSSVRSSRDSSVGSQVVNPLGSSSSPKFGARHSPKFGARHSPKFGARHSPDFTRPASETLEEAVEELKEVKDTPPNVEIEDIRQNLADITGSVITDDLLGHFLLAISTIKNSRKPNKNRFINFFASKILNNS